MNAYLQEINRLCIYLPHEDRNMNTDVFQLFDKTFILRSEEFGCVLF